ncbi:hypothetical protein [Thermococcus sp. 21S9]|uniref:hypothetical protein n=1 Tax=Thermococcus sp. 21S9 TaxID=1638223 RepID=UPI0014398AE2|nr:hypothetical protein [Thermococcus sp. 21S9]NJE54883.1 hypothetical protein [Thermococcus sp. 21S9]
MKSLSTNDMLTFFGDVFLVFLLGTVASALIYTLVGWSSSWLGINNGAWEAIASITIALLGVSVFQRGTLSTLNGGLPRFALYALVSCIPVLFLLGYWPVGSLFLGFLGGYVEKEIGKNCKTDTLHST